jgi:hypothetical protein
MPAHVQGSRVYGPRSARPYPGKIGSRNRVGAFVSAADVTNLHAKVKAQRDALANAVTSCADGTKLTAADLSEWNGVSASVDTWLADEPSTLRAGSQSDQGDQFLRDFAPWVAKLKAAGCAVIPTVTEPPKKEGLFAGLGDLSDIVKWGVVAYVLVETGVLKKLFK